MLVSLVDIGWWLLEALQNYPKYHLFGHLESKRKCVVWQGYCPQGVCFHISPSDNSSSLMSYPHVLSFGRFTDHRIRHYMIYRARLSLKPRKMRSLRFLMRPPLRTRCVLIPELFISSDLHLFIFTIFSQSNTHWYLKLCCVRQKVTSGPTFTDL